MSDFFDVLEKRNSVRKYSDKPLPEDVCKKIVEAGLRAPTAINKQEIHFTVVKNDDPVQAEIQNDLNPNAETSFFYNAPITIYLSGDESFKWTSVDAGIAVESIHLAATALGLGSVVLGCMKDVLNGEKKADYSKKLAFPEGYAYQIAIAVGYAEATKEQHSFDFEKNVTVL